MKKSILLSIFVLQFLSSHLFGQVTLSDNGTQAIKLITCQETMFSVRVGHSTFVVQDTSKLFFHLPDGMELILPGSNPNISLINDSSIQITGITGNFVNVNYVLKPKCGFFSANTISNVSHSIEVEYNHLLQTTNYTKTYSIDAPFLVFRNGLSRKLDYGLADYGVPFTRKFVYVNTGSPAFNGDVVFEDTARKTALIATMRFNSVSVVHPSAGVSIQQNTVTDTSVIFKLSINGLLSGDSIVIEEEVVVTGCEKEDSYSDFTLKYGCANEIVCETVQQDFTTTRAYLDPNNKPLLYNYSPSFRSGYNQLDMNYDHCLSDAQPRLTEIKNVGNGSASNVHFTAFGVSFMPNFGYYSKIDTNSVEVFRLDGSHVEIPVAFHKVGNISNLYNGRNNYQQYFQEYVTEDVFEPGEVIYIRYNEYVKCFDESEYDALFNVNYRYANTYLGVYLDHPCLKTEEVYGDPYMVINYGSQQHAYSFNQEFSNLEHPTVTDAEELWLDINENSPFNMGASYGNGFSFNLDSSELLIRLNIEPGFELFQDSILMVSKQGATNVVWHPESIEYFGNIVGSGNADGGYAIAHFAFPDSFYVATFHFFDPEGREKIQYNQNSTVQTAHFDRFFNDFKVTFKLKSYCTKVINSIATIEEQLFFVPNKYCNPACRMPMSKISDEIKFLCPGCILPGFNVSTFDINRLNVGYADNDDNHLPDVLPYEGTSADLTTIERKHVLIGDTIQMNIVAGTSDGEDYTFANVGFNLDEGQVFVSGDFLKNVRFIGATGKYNGQAFTVPASAGILSDQTFALPNSPVNLFSINIGATAMQSYGISGFTKFNLYDLVEIYPQFVITKNLDHGTGSNVRYSVEELNCFLYMSGNPFTGYRQRADANETLKPTDSYAALSISQRENLDYWCTGGVGRILGVGVSFSVRDYGSSEAVNLNYPYWGHNLPRSSCYKTMAQENYVGIGELSGAYYYPYNTKALSDAFPYELRNLWKKEKIELNFPSQYYELDKILITRGQFLYYPLYNTSYYTHYVVDTPVSGNPNVSIVNSTATFNLLPYYKEQTSFNPATESYHDSLLVFDEGIIEDVFFVLKMKDCDIPDTVSLNGYEMKQYFKDFIFSEGRDSIITTNYVPNTILDKPSGKLKITPFNFTSTAGNWTIRMETDKLFQNVDNDFINNFAENSFLTFVSPSGSLTVNSVLNGSTPLATSVTTDNKTLYQAGLIGSNVITRQYQKADLKINATFNCENVNQRDSLMVIYGWNCYGYPTSLETACSVDTTWLYIDVLETGLQAELTGSNSLSACEEQEYRIKLHPSGTGNVENLQIALNLPTGISYVSGSGKIEQGSNSANVEPTTANLNWDLDSISFLTDHLSSSNPDAYLSFKLSGGCYELNKSIQVLVNSTNYCGKALPTINLVKQISGNPGNAPLILDVDHSGICNGTGIINLTISNGVQTSLGLSVYSSTTNSLLGQLNVSGLNANTTASYPITLSPVDSNLYFVWSNCSCFDTVDYQFTCVCLADASFSTADVCLGSSIGANPVQPEGTHQWIYSDMNQTSTAVNPSFMATHSGNYSVTHIVISDCGASDTVVHQVTINAVSCAIIGTAPDCSHLTKVYSAPASTDNLTYAWTLASATNAVLSGSGPSVSVVSGSCSASYTLNLSVVNPATGCHSECSETFSFADITAPVYLSVPSNLLLGSCNDLPQFTAPVATDNCSAVSIIQLSDGVLSNSNGSKTYTRTWKAIDNCGNEAPVVSQSITVPACATSGNVYCTLTQGFYGNAKGVACATGERGEVLVQRLLSAPYGNLLIGKPGKMLTITSADAACLIKRLPAGGTASALPAGNHVFGANCANAIPVSNQGKFSNVLLGQTITLGLNLRMNAPLGALALSPQITTLTGNPGKDHLCGTADDVPVVGSEIQKNIPQSVITALNSIYGTHTIANLFDLANRALGGQTTGGASLADINQAVSAINEGFDGCRFLKTTNAYIISSDFGVEARDRFKTDIYPNPFSENFSIDYQYEATSRIELIVTDLFGKVVYMTDLDPKRSTHDVNLAHVADGMYLVNVILDGEPQETNRIVKTK